MPDHENPEAQGLATALGQFEKTIVIESLAAIQGKSDEPARTTVTVRKLRAKHFVGIFKCIDDLVTAGVVRLTDEAGNLIMGAKGILSEFRDEKMLLRGGDPVLEMLSIATGVPRAHVDELDLVDLGKLLGAAWEVNERFFAQNQTELKTALGPIWKLVEGLVSSKKKDEKTTTNPSDSSPESSIGSSAAATEASPK